MGKPKLTTIERDRIMLRGHGLLQHIDNPANEDRWSDAKGIADRARWPRRGMTPTLEKFERAGFIESMRQGDAPSPWSDAPPRLWRLVASPGTEEGGGDE